MTTPGSEIVRRETACDAEGKVLPLDGEGRLAVNAAIAYVLTETGGLVRIAMASRAGETHTRKPQKIETLPEPVRKHFDRFLMGDTSEENK